MIHDQVTLPAIAAPSAMRAEEEAALRAKAAEFETTFLAEMLGHAGLGEVSSNFGGGIGEEQLSALRNCPMPIYFTIGNHERYEDLDAILERLERLGVIVLRTFFHWSSSRIVSSLEVIRPLSLFASNPNVF